MKPIAAFYLGHDANVSVWDREKNRLFTIELERITGHKHFRPTHNRVESLPGQPKYWHQQSERYWSKFDLSAGRGTRYDRSKQEEHDYIKREWADPLKKVLTNTYGIDVERGFETIYLKEYNNELPRSKIPKYTIGMRFVKNHFKYDTLDTSPIWDLEHHRCHSWSSYHQSGFDKAFVWTFDGGGDNYYASIGGIDQHKTIFWHGRSLHIGTWYNNLAHKAFAYAFSSSKTSKIDSSGKVMGLSAYGRVTHSGFTDIIKYMNENYPEANKRLSRQQIKEINKDHASNLAYKDPMIKIANSFTYSLFKKYYPTQNWQHEANIAAMLQELFIRVGDRFLNEHILPKLHLYDNNLCIGGGCALNVIFNQYIRDNYPHINLFVPANPWDGGLSHGLLVDKFRNKLPRPNKYHFTDQFLYDEEDIPKYLEENNATEITVDDIVRLLYKKRIIGFISGGMELGPRALCRRSIIARANVKDMKDRINSKVKHREAFRPFGPVCRKEDAHKWFEGIGEGDDLMLYSPRVKPEFKNIYPAITHVDGTARLQTLSKEDSPIIYEVLGKVDGNILVNTSFNVSGKPILNTMSDAFEVLRKTKLDHVILHWKDKLYLFS